MTCVFYALREPERYPTFEDLKTAVEGAPRNIKVFGMTPFAARNAEVLTDLLSVPCHVILVADGFSDQGLEAYAHPKYRAYVSQDEKGSIVVTTDKEVHDHHKEDGK